MAAPHPPTESHRAGTERSWRRRLVLPLAVLLAFILIAATGYWLIEPEYSWGDSLYMTIITITTVGYTEVHPLSAWGRAWNLFVIAGGITTGTIVLSLLVAMIVEGQVRSILGRRQLNRKIEALSNHVIVCGYGAMGTPVSQNLAAAGKDVVVIESNPDRTAAAERDGLLYVLGDAQDEGVLGSAGVGRAAYLVAALPTDAENVFVTLSARQLNAGLQILSRALLPSSQGKLLRAGANRVICPQTIGATRMADVILRPAVVDFVEMSYSGVELEMEQYTIPPGSELAGRPLRELALPSRVGAHVVAIRRRDGQAEYHPTSEYVLAEGDTLVLVGQRGILTAVQKLTRQVDPPPAPQV